MVVLWTGKIKGLCPHLRITFVQRHNAEVVEEEEKTKYVPPHKINHRAIMAALKAVNVQTIVAMCSVGSLNPSISVGSVVVPHDYYSPTDVISMQDDMSGHIVPGFNEALRHCLIDALTMDGFHPLFPGGVYVQTKGPRFETKAEIRILAQAGDIVGMTGAHEATLAKEVGIPYAQVCIVDNMANGVSAASTHAKPLTLAGFHEAQRNNLSTVERALQTMLVAVENAVRVCHPDLFDSLFDDNKSEITGDASGASSKDEQLKLTGIKRSEDQALGEKTLVDLLVYAKYVITVNELNDVLENHAMAVKDGKIIAILPAIQAKESFVAVQVLNFPQSAISPGLVNAHTHTPMVFMRGFGDDMPLTQWLATHIWPAEARCVSREFVRDGILVAAAEMIRSGTTTFNDMYFFPDEAAKKIAEIGMRAFIGLIVLEFPSAMAKSAAEYLEKCNEVWDNADKSEDTLVKFTVGPHAPYSAKEADIVKVHALSVERKCPFHTHLHESAPEITAAINGDVKSGFCHMSDQRCRPLANFERLNLLDERCSFAHMTQLTDEEIELLAKKKCSVVHCPSSNMKLASGFCPVFKLNKAGVNVCLGTDGAASNNTLDMIGEMRFAALLGAGVAGVAGAVPAATVFRMATINGAKALGVSHKIGSLETGKDADFIVLNLAKVETQPTFNPLSTIVYALNRSSVSDVFVRGRALMRSRRLLTINESELEFIINNWRARMIEVEKELKET